MHHLFFHLLDKPFAARPDPRFFWLGPKQAEALAVLRREILAGKGFVLLTGDAGTGKTILVNALTAGFAQDVAWAVVGNPGPSRLDFYHALARGFGIDRQFSSKVQFLLQFSLFLQNARDAGKKVVLLVDDCHRLSRDLLEELRLLANMARDGIGLIDICFIGRREFLDILSQPTNRPMGQRLTGRVELGPLSPDETADYIGHRLKVAGGEEEIFTPRAMQLIHGAAAGNPRLINLICDQALQAGAAANSRPIEGKVIELCLAQLHLPPAGRQTAVPVKDLGRLRGLLHRLSDLFPEGRRWRWLKYGLGLVLIGGVGLSYLPPGNNGGDTGTDSGRPAVQQPVPPAKVRPELSPGVGKLEPIGKAIDLGMMPGGNEPVAKKKAEVNKKKAEANKAGEEQAGEASAESTQVAETAAGPPESAAGDAPPDQAAVLSLETAAEQVNAAPAAEQTSLPPMRRKKVVLPLRANSLELTEQAAKEFRAFCDELKNHPRAKVLVKGFVSAKTNSPGNIRLSEERAMAVQKLLVRSGIDPAGITVKGMGNQEPLAANDTKEGRTKNRRVEIEVVDDGK